MSPLAELIKRMSERQWELITRTDPVTGRTHHRIRSPDNCCPLEVFAPGYAGSFGGLEARAKSLGISYTTAIISAADDWPDDGLHHSDNIAELRRLMLGACSL